MNDLKDAKLIDVFAVYGDSVNVGKGMLIGVYEEEKHADIAVIGRGCLDNASLPYVRPAGERGQGTIEKKKAIKVNDEIYLLEVNHLIKLNTELIANKRVSCCVWEEPIVYFGVKVVDVHKPIEFMRFIRTKTGMSYSEVKNIHDKFKKNGSVIVEPFHYNLHNEITKEEFVLWKKELENVAVLEAI